MDLMFTFKILNSLLLLCEHFLSGFGLTLIEWRLFEHAVAFRVNLVAHEAVESPSFAREDLLASGLCLAPWHLTMCVSRV